ncbi:MAG: hypothetical protein FJW36_01330 [Acidobacteria bacterium]|nr:hypothetical protein [Acidobacteriota bacterium]
MMRGLHEKDPANIKVTNEYLIALTDLSVTDRRWNKPPQSCALAATSMGLVKRFPEVSKISNFAVIKAQKLSALCPALK